MKKLILALALLTLTVIYLTKFKTVDDIPSKLFAGEIHYSRIPVEYW